MKRILSLSGALLALSMGFTSAANAAASTKVTANLFGDAVAKAKVVYQEKEANSGETKRRFKVKLEQAMPLQTFEVLVNGSLVGTMTTNAGGSASFEMRTNGDVPLPPEFPSLGVGDTVAVGPLSGVFFDKGWGKLQKFRVDGQTSSSDAIHAKVRYEERFKKNTGLERRFRVNVEDAAPDTFYSVSVNGEFIGGVTTDSTGEGTFKLRSVHSNEDWQPMPETFPSLQVGDVVTVGEATITLG